jgi:hypothetical protein
LHRHRYGSGECFLLEQQDERCQSEILGIRRLEVLKKGATRRDAEEMDGLELCIGPAER